MATSTTEVKIDLITVGGYTFPPLVTYSEVQRILECSRPHIDREVEAGKLERVTLSPAKVRITGRSLAEYLRGAGL